MSSSLPINCINADLLKIIFQKFNHQSSEKKFSKQRAEVVELRLRKDWNRIYTELVDEGHWNPNKNKRKRIKGEITNNHKITCKSYKTASNLLPFHGNQNGLNIDYLKGNDLNNNSQDIVLSNITNMGNNSCSKPRVGNIENKFQTPSFKSVVYPQRKEKLLKEKEVDKKDNKEKINKSFDILRSRGYKCDESIHYEINSVDDENDKSSLENKKTSDKKINEGILLCDLKKHTTQEIIKKYEKHIDGLLESQKELSKKMSDFSILLTKKIESINKTQNQILDHFEKYQAGTKCLDQNKKTIFDLTFIENLTNNTLKQTHEMTKRSLLKIKAKDGFNILRLPQPNEARKASRCLQVRLCKQKTKIINYFIKTRIENKYSDQNSPDRFTLFQQIPNSCFDTIYHDMSHSVQLKCLHLWLNIYFKS